MLALSPIYALGAAYVSLQSAVDGFDRAERSLRSGTGDVETLLTDAIGSAQRGAELMKDPLVTALATVTTTKDDLDAAHALALIAEDATEFGLDVWRLLNEAGPRLYKNGKIDFDVARSLDGDLAGLAGEIATLQDRVAASGPGSLSIVRDAYERAAKRLVTAESALETARRALAMLPKLFAEDGERRYLIAFLSPSEARGGGGLPGVFIVLRARDGAFELGEIRANEPLNEALDDKRISAPKWYEHLYGDLTALEDVRQVNLSPSFPATSSVLLDMYRTAYGKQLDGVVAMDPFVLGNLTKPLGSLEAEGWDVTIKPSNARRLLLHDIYVEFPQELEKEQNIYSGRLVDEVWRRISEGDFELASIAAALAESAAGQHLKVYATDRSVETVLRDLGIAGDPRSAGANVHEFFHNNFAGNKIDYFLHREHDVTISLDESGTAHVTAEVTIRNDAPLTPVNVLNRPVRSHLPVGLARMSNHFLLPRDAEVTRTEQAGSRVRFFGGEDSGYPIRWTSSSVSADSEETFAIEYSIPDAVVDGRFEFTLWPQVLPFPDRFHIELIAPGEVRDHTFQDADDGTFTSTGTLKTPKTFEVELLED